MTVATVKTRLITICEAIPGIQGASREPRNLTGAEMPWVIVLAGPAEYQTDGEALGRELRTYRLLVIVQAWAQGPEYEAETLVEPFYERFREEFSNNASLDTGNHDPLPGVQWSQIVRDTGLTEIILAGVSYAGVEVNIQVLEVYNVCKR
jgi:hypothetical protein